MKIQTNPVENKLQVRIFEPQDKPVEMEIIDIDGRRVWVEKVERIPRNEDLCFDVSSLIPGYYFLKMQSGFDSVVVKSFLKE